MDGEAFALRAVQHEVKVFRLELAQRRAEREAVVLGERRQHRVPPLAAFQPGALRTGDPTVEVAALRIRDQQRRVKRPNAAQTVAAPARAGVAVEREVAGRNFGLQLEATRRTGWLLAIASVLAAGFVDPYLAVALGQCQFNRISQAAPVLGVGRHAVDHQLQALRGCSVGANGFQLSYLAV